MSADRILKTAALMSSATAFILLVGCDEVAFSYHEDRPRREVVVVEPPPRVTVIEESPVHEVHVVERAPHVHVVHPRPVTEVHVVHPHRGYNEVKVVPPAPGPGYSWDGRRWVKIKHFEKGKDRGPKPPPPRKYSDD